METPFQRFVLGFLFSPNYQEVVLVEKQYPDYQKGKFNGIGGIVKSGETTQDAMTRKFQEETGLFVPHWEMFSYIRSEKYDIMCFCTTSTTWTRAVAPEGKEKVGAFNLENLNTLPTLGNTKFLIPMAIDKLTNQHTYLGSQFQY